MEDVKRKYRFVKKRVDIPLDYHDIDYLIHVLQKYQSKLFDMDTDDMNDVIIVIRSLLEDLYDFLILGHNYFSIHQLEVDLLLNVLIESKSKFDESIEKIIVKYIDRLLPYVQIYSDDIKKFNKLPREVKEDIISTLYSTPYGDVIEGEI